MFHRWILLNCVKGRILETDFIIKLIEKKKCLIQISTNTLSYCKNKINQKNDCGNNSNWSSTAQEIQSVNEFKLFSISIKKFSRTNLWVFGCQEFLDFVSDQFCNRQIALAMNNKHPVNESKAEVFHGHLFT